jgi:C_GCAxxG_C_C family probable redox protein
MNEKERAVELFKEGFNCAQSVFTAFSHRFGIDEDTAKRISAGLGGGVGRMREVCGAVSGAAMVIGSLVAATEGHDAEGKQKNYELVQEFAKRFTEENGTVICRELLGLDVANEKSPKPEKRTAEYYHKRPCVELVECAAAILQDIIKENE